MAGVGFAFKGGPVLWGVVLVVAAAPPRHRQALRVCVCVRVRDIQNPLRLAAKPINNEC